MTQRELGRRPLRGVAQVAASTFQGASGQFTAFLHALFKAVETSPNVSLVFTLAVGKDMFSPRQLLGHCIGVEVFHDIVSSISEQNGGEVPEIDKAALVYVAFAMDKLLNYNCNSVRWIPQREVVAGKWDRHDFSVKWSFAEIAPAITGSAYDWAFEQTGKALEELIELVGSHQEELGLFAKTKGNGSLRIIHGSGDFLDLPDSTLDRVVIDPPYYNNVTYSELSDFFYVWLKRTAGIVVSEGFTDHLTDKDREAVANLFRFRGQKHAL